MTQSTLEVGMWPVGYFGHILVAGWSHKHREKWEQVIRDMGTLITDTTFSNEEYDKEEEIWPVGNMPLLIIHVLYKGVN